MKNNKEINEDTIDNIVGGTEPVPEEFDWKTKGFVTPTKEEETDPNKFPFTAIGPITNLIEKLKHRK